MSLTEEERNQFMRFAIEQAEVALINEEVPVGCVFINPESKQVISTGHNKTNETGNGTEHAEIVAIKDALYQRFVNASVFQGSILFVSCEPCIMCAGAIAKMGIRAVYYGCSNDRFGGNGSILSVHNTTALNQGHQYSVHAGLLEEEAIAIFQRFYDTENRRAPDHKRRRKGEKSEAGSTELMK
eukprot:gene7545-8146_t